MSNIRPIETQYMGYRFRSRLEARWATFFNALGLRWEYEKEGYDLGKAGWYLPDFWLPDVGLRRDITAFGLWVEIKPAKPTETEDKKCELLAKSGSPVILFVGLPGEYPGDSGYQFECLSDDGEHVGWDNCMCFMRCYNHKCKYTKIEFMESNYCYCPKCYHTADNAHPDLMHAANQAKAARFEHNERS